LNALSNRDYGRAAGARLGLASNREIAQYEALASSLAR